MQYRIDIEGREVLIDVIEQRTGSLKLAQGDGVLEVEWAVCPNYPMVALLIEGRPHFFFMVKKGREYYLASEGRPLRVETKRKSSKRNLRRAKEKAGIEVVKSPLSGLVTAVLVEPGQKIRRGDPLVVLEAMKMRNEIKAPKAGEVLDIKVMPGMSVELGFGLVTIRVG